MIYVEEIKIIKNPIKDKILFDIGQTIPCKDVTIFAGNQGCGKSTILNLLKTNDKNFIELKTS